MGLLWYYAGCRDGCLNALHTFFNPASNSKNNHDECRWCRINPPLVLLVPCKETRETRMVKSNLCSCRIVRSPAMPSCIQTGSNNGNHYAHR